MNERMGERMNKRTTAGTEGRRDGGTEGRRSLTFLVQSALLGWLGVDSAKALWHYGNMAIRCKL